MFMTEINRPLSSRDFSVSSSTKVNFKVKVGLLYATSVRLYNPLKGRGVNWLHFAIQV